MVLQTTELKEKSRAPSVVSESNRAVFPKAIIAILIYAVITLALAPLSLHEKPTLSKSVVLSSHYEQRGKGPWSWWLSRAYFLNQPAEVVLMGDSQMNAAIMQVDAIASRKNLDVLTDREAITLERSLKEKLGRPIKAVNLALAGAMISDQYLISKTLFSARPPKILILGVSPRSFLDNAMVAASVTEPFHYFQRYVKVDSLVPYSFSDWLAQADWFLQEYFPLKQFYEPIKTSFESVILFWNSSDRAHDKGKLYRPAEIVKSKPRDLTQTKAARQLQAIFGGADEPALGENLIAPVPLYGFIDNTAEYKRRYHDSASPNYDKQNEFFKEYLSLLNKLGCRTIVLGMPVLVSNRQLLPEEFWRKYRKQMKEECARVSASWIDLSQDSAFDKTDFLDNVHLNAKGGFLLIERLVDIITNKSSIAP